MAKEDMNGNLVPELPDIQHKGPEDGINYSAWMVWKAVTSSPSYRQLTSQHKFIVKGRTGKLWQGVAKDYVFGLWPDLSERHLISEESADEITTALNKHLRDSTNMMVRIPGGRRTPSTWWISDDFYPLTVKSVPSEFSDVSTGTIPGEPNLPEENTSSNYACREDNCDLSFNRAVHRVAHEKSKHGLWIDPEGTPYRFEVGASGPTDDKLSESIINYIGNRSLTLEDVRINVFRIYPMIKRERLDSAIKSLITDPYHGLQLEYHTYRGDDKVTYRRYRVIEAGSGSAGPKRSNSRTGKRNGDEIRAKNVAETVPNSVDEKSLKVAEDLLKMIDDLKERADRLRGRDNHELVDKISELETALEDKNEEIASLNSKISELESELQLKASELDEFRQKVSAFKSLFGG